MGKLKELRAEMTAAKDERKKLQTLLYENEYGNGKKSGFDRLTMIRAIGDLDFMIHGLKDEIADIKAKKSTAKSTKGGSRYKKSKKTRKNRQ